MDPRTLLSRVFLLACALAMGINLALAQARAAPEAILPVLPTTAQLQQAMDRVKPGAPRIRELLGCVPAFGQPETVRLCATMAEGRDFVDSLPFRFDNGRWDVVLDQTGAPPTIEGACAPLNIAQTAFRKLRGDAGLNVIGEVDDGEGLFTDERGMLRDKKGPYRLMCRYEVGTGFGNKYLIITYIWHDGSHYVVDPDIEVWPDD